MKKLFVLALFGFLISACGSEAPKTETTTDTTPQEEVVAKVDGKKIYQMHCTACHGLFGDQETNGAKDLTVSTISMEEKIEQITNGKGLMTPYKDILSEEEIKAVAEYTEALKEN